MAFLTSWLGCLSAKSRINSNLCCLSFFSSRYTSALRCLWASSLAKAVFHVEVVSLHVQFLLFSNQCNSYLPSRPMSAANFISCCSSGISAAFRSLYLTQIKKGDVLKRSLVNIDYAKHQWKKETWQNFLTFFFK